MDACSRASSRSRAMCEDEVGSAESDETTRIDAERAAEALRNAYYAEGGDEGGRCKNASSDAGAYRPMLNDDPALKVSLRTAAIDHPLEDDPWGNALAAGVAGGIVAGARSATMDALIPIAPRPIVQNVAVGTAKEVAKKEAFVAVKESMNMGPSEVATRAPESDAPPPAGGASTSSTASSAGMSTRSATSAPASEPLASTVERPYLVIAP